MIWLSKTNRGISTIINDLLPDEDKGAKAVASQKLLKFPLPSNARIQTLIVVLSSYILHQAHSLSKFIQ